LHAIFSRTARPGVAARVAEDDEREIGLKLLDRVRRHGGERCSATRLRQPRLRHRRRRAPRHPRQTAPQRRARHRAHLAPIRQRIESIFWTCKDLLTLERHGLAPCPACANECSHASALSPPPSHSTTNSDAPAVHSSTTAPNARNQSSSLNRRAFHDFWRTAVGSSPGAMAMGASRRDALRHPHDRVRDVDERRHGATAILPDWLAIVWTVVSSRSSSFTCVTSGDARQRRVWHSSHVLMASAWSSCSRRPRSTTSTSRHLLAARLRQRGRRLPSLDPCPDPGRPFGQPAVADHLDRPRGDGLHVVTGGFVAPVTWLLVAYFARRPCSGDRRLSRSRPRALHSRHLAHLVVRTAPRRSRLSRWRRWSANWTCAQRWL